MTFGAVVAAGISVAGGIYSGNQSKKQGRYAREAAERDEHERQKRIGLGREDIKRIFGQQFTPEFFSGIEKSYGDWAAPQLDKQDKNARENLLYALARAGTTRSGVRAKGFGELQEQYDLGRQTVAQQGSDLANRRRGDVENQRQSIEAQLYATADPAAAAASAQNASFNASFRPEYNPLSQLVTDVSGWYGLPQSSLPGFIQQSAGSGAGRGSKSGYRVGG